MAAYTRQLGLFLMGTFNGLDDGPVARATGLLSDRLVTYPDGQGLMKSSGGEGECVPEAI
jgi:hypothetical protein